MPELLDLLAAPAFHIGGTPASWLELVAAVLALAAQSSLVADSSSLWLTPSLQGTKIMPAGANRAA